MTAVGTSKRRNDNGWLVFNNNEHGLSTLGKEQLGNVWSPSL
jgi:hypothetical protein